MLANLLLVLHIISAVLLILLVLMQPDKGGSMIGMGGASQTLFGSQGSGSFIAKLTGFCGGILFITSFTLSALASHSNLAELDASPSTVQTLPSKK